MKSIVVNTFGIDQITIEEHEKPILKADEVLIKVQAFSLNYVDLMIAKGWFPLPVPYHLGCDAAGVVEAVGSDVISYQPGDVVATHFMREWEAGPIKESYTTLPARTLGGSFAEYIATSEKGLIKAPTHLSAEEIATLPIAGISAWEGLFNVGKLKAGDSVLLLGTGGVSIFALQFAKAAGAIVIITSGSDEKLAKAKALGADYTINYNSAPDWEEKVLEYTGGEGVDIALEVVGSTLAKTAKAVRVGGSIALIGLVGGAVAEINVVDLLQRPVKIEVVEGASKSTFREMNKAIERNLIKPVIDQVFTFADTRTAFEHASLGQHFGKVVVAV